MEPKIVVFRIFKKEEKAQVGAFSVFYKFWRMAGQPSVFYGIYLAPSVLLTVT